MGDNLTDLKFMAQCDFMITPAKSQLAQAASPFPYGGCK
jgi:hypothetical protein